MLKRVDKVMEEDKACVGEGTAAMEVANSGRPIPESNWTSSSASNDVRRASKRSLSSRSGHSHRKDRKRLKEDVAELVNKTLDIQYQLRKESSVSSGDDALEDTPIGIGKTEAGHLIMACNAKGMPLDHNHRTAYFIIGSDIKHGHGLLCSHLLCQREGLKFKYCSFCQAPVPKLNFSTRHDHSSQQAKSEASDESQGGTAPRDQAGIPYQVTTKQKSEAGATDESTSNSSVQAELTVDATKKVSEASSAAGAANAQSETLTSGSTSSLRQSGFSSTSSDQSSSRGSANEARGVAKRPELDDGAPNESNDEHRSASVPQRGLEALDTTRRFKWARLLGNRPRTDNRGDLSSWLLDVLAVSDLNASLNVSASSSPTTDDSCSETRETNTGSTDASAPTDQSGTAGSSRTDGSSANDSSSDTRETNNQSTTDSNDSANDSASDTQDPEPANQNVE